MNHDKIQKQDQDEQCWSQDSEKLNDTVQKSLRNSENGPSAAQNWRITRSCLLRGAELIRQSFVEVSYGPNHASCMISERKVAMLRLHVCTSCAKTSQRRSPWGLCAAWIEACSHSGTKKHTITSPFAGRRCKSYQRQLMCRWATKHHDQNCMSAVCQSGSHSFSCLSAAVLFRTMPVSTSPYKLRALLHAIKMSPKKPCSLLVQQ